MCHIVPICVFCVLCHIAPICHFSVELEGGFWGQDEACTELALYQHFIYTHNKFVRSHPTSKYKAITNHDFFISRSTLITVAGLLLALSSPTTTAAINAQPHCCIKVVPGQSITDEVWNAHADGILLPKFTLHAEKAGSETIYEVEVCEAQPAVTSETTVSFQGGKSKHVDEDTGYFAGF